LVIPDALGIKVEFLKGEGPKLEQILTEKELLRFNPQKLDKLNPVLETIALTKSKLDDNTALIGFSGSPWTIASYIIEGGGSKTFEKARGIAIRDEQFFGKLIDILVESIILYLSKQINAGAEVVKLFDSWAGVLPEQQYRKWVLEPNKRIIDSIKDQFPQIPVILFARGSGLMYEDLVKEIKSDAFAIDQNLPKKWAREILQEKHNAIIQGNLDNILLADGSLELLELEVKSILENFGNHPFIFNLGHGVLPHTKIENVQKVIDLVRSS
jgi:uroporphyrinogen decarboxylase